MIMADPNEPIHIDTEDARAGATPHMTRYILAISLVLVIVIFGFIILR
ncbi:regulator [Sphingomonas sp. Leaf230]|nr:regulator [Sphingomonas sp. Leaf208]KQN06215.1 regulator [Sphingomonas sp. Leaf230]